MALSTFLLATLASSAAAVNVFVTSYADPNATKGKITTFQLNLGLAQGYARQSGSLKTLATNNADCGSAPTWLDFGEGNILYCIDEGFQTPNASINTLTINADGSTKGIASIDTIQGPVSNQFYNNRKAVALAHYGGSAISSFKSDPKGTFSPLQNFVFNTPPGPRPEQEASHVHEAIIDPTGKFLLFPDLGADVVRVYSFDAATSLLKAETPLKSTAASGPRHAVFWQAESTGYGKWKQDGQTYLFVIHELSNVIVSYKVGYPAAGGLTFDKVQEIGLYGDRAQPVGTRAAEIAVSPDNKFIVSSNRNATIFTVANPDPKNSTAVPSDSLTTFKPSNDGKLTFVGLSASGGSFPRHFSFNKAGTLVGIGNQNSGTVFIFSRDTKTGKISETPVAATTGLGQVTNVRFRE